MKAEVYYNIRKKILSVRVSGKVVAHSETVAIYNPTFHVSEAGRQRVLAQKRKNVHAFIRGEWDGIIRNTPSNVIPEDSISVSYNPYKNTSFVASSTEIPVRSGRFALINRNKIFVQL